VPTTLATDFHGLTIAYDDTVLTPRPWTGQQSRWAADLLATAPDGPVLELCAGAGQIGLLALAYAGAAGHPRHLVAVDASAAACGFARRNADAAGLGEHVEVRHGRLEEALAPQERFALVIADPPWVPSTDTGQFPDDPLTAIDGGPDGLDLARACVRTAADHLLPGAAVVLQLGHRDQVDRLDAEPLQVREVRDGERGVLVLLAP